MNNTRTLKVMIAGIGGASLGTEILKCLMNVKDLSKSLKGGEP